MGSPEHVLLNILYQGGKNGTDQNNLKQFTTAFKLTKLDGNKSIEMRNDGKLHTE